MEGLEESQVVADKASKEMPTDLQRLTDQHRVVAREILKGKSNQEAADAVGMSAGYISKLKSSEMFQLYMAKLRDELDNYFTEFEGSRSRLDYVKNRARELTPSAMDALQEIVEQEGDLGNRRQSALDLLSMTGDLGSLKEATISNHTPAIFVNIELHQELDEELKEAQGVVIDVAGVVAGEAGADMRTDMRTDLKVDMRSIDAG